MRRPDDPQGGRSVGNVNTGGAVATVAGVAGPVCGETSGDRCDRISNETAHRPLLDPSAHRLRGGRHVDGDGMRLSEPPDSILSYLIGGATGVANVSSERRRSVPESSS